MVFFGQALATVSSKKVLDNTINLPSKITQKTKAPQKIACFMWLIPYCACLTQSNLRREGDLQQMLLMQHGRIVQQPFLFAFHSGKAITVSSFESFQLAFCRAFHCERNVNCGIRKPARSMQVIVSALSVGFCGRKEMVDVLRGKFHMYQR